MATFPRPTEPLEPFPGTPAGMTPLQGRSYMATMGTGGESGRFMDDLAKKYYTDLLTLSVTDPQGGLLPGANLLPIEQQYLTQAYGLDPTVGLEGILQALQGTPPAGSPAQSLQAPGFPKGGDQGTPQGPDTPYSEGEFPDFGEAGRFGLAATTPMTGIGGLVAAINSAMKNTPAVFGGSVAPPVGTQGFDQAQGEFGPGVGPQGGIGATGGPGFGPPGGGATPGFGGGGGMGGMGGGDDFSGVGTGSGGDMGAGMLHGGGQVSESEKPGTAQDVNKTLQEGEYVMSRDAVKAFGAEIFNALNAVAKRKK